MKIKAIILGIAFGLIAGAMILFMPVPFRSAPYWIRQFEEAGLNHLTSLLFPNPYSTGRDVFFMLMGLLHFFIWAVAGALMFFGGAVLFSKTQRR